MADVNYKMKYDSLKGKFMSSVDMAFRLGYEQGAKDSEVQQAADAQQQAAQEQSGQPGEDNSQQPGQDASGAPAPGQEQQAGAPMQESENPAGSELDQHIEMLESMLSKGEICGTDLSRDLFADVTGERVCSICKLKFIGGLPTTQDRINVARVVLGLAKGEYYQQDNGKEAARILGRQ